MKLMQFAVQAGSACGIAVALVGTAAASDVSNVGTTTGPGSAQTITITNSAAFTNVNTNVVTIVNQNIQQASTGDVTASGNTKVGDLKSGDASNVNTTTTAVTIGNATVSQPDGSSDQPGGGSTGGQGGNSAGGPVGGQGAMPSGTVLGAATTAGGLGGVAAVLPVTGPTDPVDVSAIRAAWQPQTSAPTVSLAKKTAPISAAMLIVASVLSLIGATGSLMFAKRREGRV